MLWWGRALWTNCARNCLERRLLDFQDSSMHMNFLWCWTRRSNECSHSPSAECLTQPLLTIIPRKILSPGEDGRNRAVGPITWNEMQDWRLSEHNEQQSSKHIHHRKMMEWKISVTLKKHYGAFEHQESRCCALLNSCLLPLIWTEKNWDNLSPRMHRAGCHERCREIHENTWFWAWASERRVIAEHEIWQRVLLLIDIASIKIAINIKKYSVCKFQRIQSTLKFIISFLIIIDKI